MKQATTKRINGFCYDSISKEVMKKFLRKHKIRGHKEENKYYREIYELYTDVMREKISEGSMVILPRRLGFIQGFSEKGNENAVDWNKTFKFWEENPELKGKEFINFDNSKTGGKVVRIQYEPSFKNARRRSLFKYSSDRSLARGLAKMIKDDPEKINNFLDRDNKKAYIDEVRKNRQVKGEDTLFEQEIY